MTFTPSRLSDRDQAVVQSVLRYGQVSTSQLLRLHFSEPETSPRSRHQRACRSLKRLTKWKEVGRISRQIGGGNRGSGEFIYVPPSSRREIPDPHTLAITELYVRLVETGCKLTYLPEPWSYDQYGNTEVKPDAKAIIETPSGKYQWYIEIDRSTEFGPQLSAKMRRYISAWRQRSTSFFPFVVYVVPDLERRRFVASIIRRQEVDEMFQVVLFDDAVELLTR